MNPNPYKVYLWISVVLSVFGGAYLIYKYYLALRSRPLIRKSDILFQEWFASGSSMKNVLTRIGGASRVLRLVVTKDLLWVTSWFPFLLITTFYDLEHVIPRHKISVIEVESNSRIIRLTYTDQSGSTHSLKLIPKDVIGFMQALGRLS